MGIKASTIESKRRSLVKSLIWRVVGIIWTWAGAYIILLLVPPSQKNAPFIATLIVAYHHSTRMIMYYFYERVWSAIAWGKFNPESDTFAPPDTKDVFLWTLGTVAALGVIFFLIFVVTPLVKHS